VRIAGIADDEAGGGRDILGTMQYTAPEYFLGEGGSPASDLFSLGVITYQMLTGRLPYGAEVAKTKTRSQQRKLRYRSALDANREIPVWIDGALRKAVHPDPFQRYQELSEFVFDLRHANRKSAETAPTPWMERNPVIFWKVMSAVLFTISLTLLGYLLTHAK
jgi:serine/threonine protein kinase